MKWTKFAQNVVITNIGRQQYIFIHRVGGGDVVGDKDNNDDDDGKAGDLQQSLLYE